jgi:hypothetical protein
MDKFESVGQLQWARNKILAGRGEGKTVVHVCMTGCRAYGAAAVKEALDYRKTLRFEPPAVMDFAPRHR